LLFLVLGLFWLILVEVMIVVVFVPMVFSLSATSTMLLCIICSFLTVSSWRRWCSCLLVTVTFSIICRWLTVCRCSLILCGSS